MTLRLVAQTGGMRTMQGGDLLECTECGEQVYEGDPHVCLPRYWSFRAGQRDHVVLTTMTPEANEDDEHRPRAACGYKPSRPWISGYRGQSPNTCVRCLRKVEELGLHLPVGGLYVGQL